MYTLLNPKIDFVFKKIFGNEKKPEILISFLNSIFDNPKDPIVSVEIKNTDLQKDFKEDKFSMLDIKAETSRNEIVNIEIQVLDNKDMTHRTLYYWSKLFSEQLLVKGEYKSLKRTICINILDYKFLENDNNFHSVFRLKEINRGFELTDLQEFHFIELPKFKEYRKDNLFDSWINFISNPQSDINLSGEDKKIIEDAKVELIRISGNEEERKTYEQRMKILYDKKSALANAKDEGIEIGMNKGIDIGIDRGIDIGIDRGIDISKRETARNLLKFLTDEDISKATGLSVEDVTKLRLEDN